MKAAGESEHLDADHDSELQCVPVSQGLSLVAAHVQAQLRQCCQRLACQLLLVCFLCAHPAHTASMLDKSYKQ